MEKSYLHCCAFLHICYSLALICLMYLTKVLLLLLVVLFLSDIFLYIKTFRVHRIVLTRDKLSCGLFLLFSCVLYIAITRLICTNIMLNSYNVLMYIIIRSNFFFYFILFCSM